MMIIIGENIHIISACVSGAIRNRDPRPLRRLALAQAEGGVDFMDINIGPARRDGPEIMRWIVETVQEVSSLPLCLDTTNREAIEAGLKVSKGRALINSASMRPGMIESLAPLAVKYGAGLIGLTLDGEGIPRDAAERGYLASSLIAAAAGLGLKEADLWIDPIVLPVATQQLQLRGCPEFLEMLPELAPCAKSVCGLSNISSGAPHGLRPILNRTYLIMMKRYGLSAIIADAFDPEIHAIARGTRPALEALIHRVMDGEDLDLSSLCTEERNYVRTTRVLLGNSIYSNFWLQA